jgi:hypothetical protein
LPSAVEGEFGLRFRTLLVSLKHVAGISLLRTRSLLEQFGIVISPAERREHPARRGRASAAGMGGDLSGRRSGHDHVSLLIGDDANRRRHLSDEFDLCWIPEGRHYPKLSPVVPCHQRGSSRRSDNALGTWSVNDTSTGPRRRRQGPSSCGWNFGTKTGDATRDRRTAQSGRKNTRPLTVPDHPEIPLHQKPAELDERVGARRREVACTADTRRERTRWSRSRRMYQRRTSAW